MSSNKLQQITPVKEQFSPLNKKHMKIAQHFFRESRWGQFGCPFVLEWPYEDIPYMLKTKITEYTLKAGK
jgi:hypothetical protein